MSDNKISQLSNETYVTPPVDICETQQQLTLYADMPGVVQENLSLDFDKGILTLDGWYDQHLDGENESTGERVRHHYRRRFGIGNKFDPQQAEATLSAGVLSVTLLRLQATLPQRIQVKVAQ